MLAAIYFKTNIVVSKMLSWSTMTTIDTIVYDQSQPTHIVSKQLTLHDELTAAECWCCLDIVQWCKIFDNDVKY